jgi:alanine-glyoxylate transaminase/serine-glyoxylate transaminase/serine-pyruvate transaminase
MTPGPSNVHPRVLQALIAPLVGHKDPYFLALMEDTAALLRQVFDTSNRATLALPASGGSGMEAALINLLEPGDTVVIASAGFFAHRMVDI